MSDATTGAFGGADRDKKKDSILGRFNAKLQDAVQQGRAEEAVKNKGETDLSREAAIPADDMALRNAQATAPQRMIVPQGVVIEGAMSSGSDTQIGGRVDGDVRVEARLALEPSGVITGKVRAGSCVIRGKVHGDLESQQDLTVGETGVINADAIAGKDLTIAGEVNGNVKCGGRLRLAHTAKLSGNIRARSVLIEEGALFNGQCNMTKPGGNKGDTKKG